MAAKAKKKGGAAALPLNIPLLEETFAALAPSGEALVKRFYQLLFERHPDVEPLFANLTIEEQESKLLAALVTLVNSLNDPKALVATLTSLGKRHQKYGAVAAPAAPAPVPAARKKDSGEDWEDFQGLLPRQVRQSRGAGLRSCAARYVLSLSSRSGRIPKQRNIVGHRAALQCVETPHLDR